jgi:D-proline reductase (dithiol) PrdB
VSLIANYLEANGIPTVVMGCAKDIVEYCGVPRFLFCDFPLGCPTGRPNDEDSQRKTLELALCLLQSAPAPRTTVQSPERWSDNPDWKLDFFNVPRMTEVEFARVRDEELAWRKPPP